MHVIYSIPDALVSNSDASSVDIPNISISICKSSVENKSSVPMDLSPFSSLLPSSNSACHCEEAVSCGLIGDIFDPLNNSFFAASKVLKFEITDASVTNETS